MIVNLELLYFGNNCLESIGVVDCEVSEHLAVDFDASLVQQTHQLAIAEALHAGSGIDTLNPKSAEVALLGTTVAVSIGKTLLPSVLGNGLVKPRIFFLLALEAT